MTKYRIVESDGKFYPQFKAGLFWRRRHFTPNADTMRYPALVRWVEARRSERSARFEDRQQAQDFIDRVHAAATAGWQRFNNE